MVKSTKLQEEINYTAVLVAQKTDLGIPLSFVLRNPVLKAQIAR